MQSVVLRARLLGAIATGMALVPACTPKEPAPAPPAPATSTTVVVTAPPLPPACAADAKIEQYCYPAGKGPVRQNPNPHFTFDAQGCVANEQVVDSCLGVESVISGPKIDGKNCCYQVCRGPVAPCGRPLLTANREARVARKAERRDWLADGIDVRPLPAQLAERLRDAWLEDAAAEHASVAAFARFSLELLAVGAPASLVAESQQAGLDEIEHARVCYAIAAAYGGTAVGPTPLALGGVILRSDLAAVAAAAAEEACVGETFSALALAEARDGCTDPVIRAMLAKTAEDEARHAELGFRFVAWAIARGGEDVRSSVHAAFDRAVAEPGYVSGRDDDPAWRAAGRLGERDRRDVWRRAVREVILPSRAGLSGV